MVYELGFIPQREMSMQIMHLHLKEQFQIEITKFDSIILHHYVLISV